MVGAESGGDVVPCACGDACEGKPLRLDDEEMGVSVLFDGEEDRLSLPVELGGCEGAGGFADGFRGIVGDGDLVCGLGAGKEEEGGNGYYYVIAKTAPSSQRHAYRVGRGMQGHG